MSDSGYSVREFGARGDGQTDDTEAFQKAIDAAAETGATIQVPDGAYVCGTLKLRPRVGLSGNPTWSYRSPGGSIIRLRDGDGPALLDLTGAQGVTVNGLSLEGGKLGEAVHGIMYDKPDYGKEEDSPRIERCHVAHFSGDAVRLGRIWCFSIRGCMLCFCGGNGIRVRGWDGFILDNWLSGNAGAGYAALDENASITMTGNRIEWNHLGGIVADGAWHYNITGNYIDRSGGPGIRLRRRGEGRARVISITGNVIYRSGKPDWRELGEHESCHVHVDGAQGLSMTGNTLNVGRDDGGKGEWSPDYGIVYGGLENAVISGNVLHDACLKELLLESAENGSGVIVKDNPGSIFAP